MAARKKIKKASGKRAKPAAKKKAASKRAKPKARAAASRKDGDASLVYSDIRRTLHGAILRSLR